MGFRFESPLYLLLLAPAAAYIWWILRSTGRLAAGRRRTIAVLRAVIVLLLIFALAGLQTVTSLERRAVVFVADRSDSIANAGELERWIREAAAAKAPNDLAGVVAAAKEPAVERNPGAGSLDQFELSSVVEPQFTDLDKALQLAAAVLPEDASPRIVLLSDGRENIGDVLRQGRLLRDRGIPVDVVPLPAASPQDASVDSLRLPSRLFQAEQFAMEVAVTSTFSGEGELRIYEDNREIASLKVALEPGTSRFALQGLATDIGLHRYRAELYAAGDERSANNAAYAFSRVTGPPQVLIVEGEEGDAENAASALDSALIPHHRVLPEMLPQELSDYAAYDAIVLANVPATRLSERRMQMIEQAVRDYGVGLVMTGGENSFGLGGYFHTPIERALPVYMDLRGKREMPSLALALVIDKSGSMSGEPIELAQEAAVRTAELLREQDTIGVLAFDSSPWWVVEARKLDDKEAVLRDISSITADGGTDIYAALREAFAVWKDVDAQRKHIILLTDGQSGAAGSYEALAEEMKAAGISLSTVAIGDGADVQLLERIASLAGGRSYVAGDRSTIPAIFSREAVLISRTYIVDQPFVPSVTGAAADWYAMFADGVPRVNAYVAATPKETAETVLVSPEPDPLLARWQYGAGRAVAWTSDLAGGWSGDWAMWDRFPDVFGRIVKWTFPQFEAAPMELESRLSGGEAVLYARGGQEDIRGNVTAVLTDESLAQRRVELAPAAPGEFVGRTGPLAPGAYLTRLETEEGGIAQTTGFVVPYSPEYAIGGKDGAAVLRELAELTGGRVLELDHPAAAFAGDTSVKQRYGDLWRGLLMAAVLLWVADIALRRLQLPWERLAQLLRGRGGMPAGAAGTPASEGGSAAAAGTMERLRGRVGARREGAGAAGGGVPGRAEAGASPNAGRPASPAGDQRSASRADAARPASSANAPRPAASAESAKPQATEPKTTDADERMRRLLEARRRRGK